MADLFTAHNRFLATGLTGDQARLLLRLLADAQGGRFERQVVLEQISAMQLTPQQTAALVAELLQRIARQAAGRG